jgi:hypothetical protein
MTIIPSYRKIHQLIQKLFQGGELGCRRGWFKEPTLQTAAERDEKYFPDASHFESWSAFQIWKRNVT